MRRIVCCVGMSLGLVFGLAACSGGSDDAGTAGSAHAAAASGLGAGLQGRVAHACGYDSNDLKLGRRADALLNEVEDPGGLFIDQATSSFMQGWMGARAGAGHHFLGYLQEWVTPDGSVVYLSGDETAHCSKSHKTVSVAL